MDVKTVLLLGIGMVVLFLIGLCTAPSQSADLPLDRQLAPVMSASLGWAGTGNIVLISKLAQGSMSK
jgi:hypothetical protein